MTRYITLIALLSAHAWAADYSFPPKKAAVAVSDATHYTNVTVLKFLEGSRLVLNGTTFSVTHQVTTRDTKFRSRYGLTKASIDADVSALNSLMTSYGATPRRLFLGQETSDLNQARDEGESLSGNELGTLDLFFTVEIPAGSSVDLQNALSALGTVQIAYAMPRPQIPGFDVAPTTPNFTGLQLHMTTSSLSSMNFTFSQARQGGSGENCAIYDVEMGAVLTHEDLPTTWLPQIGINDINSIPNRDHGTSVLGVLAAEANAYGMTGVSPFARVGLASPSWPLGFWPYSPAHAITAATNALRQPTQTRPIRIIMIEQQFWADVAFPGEILGTVSPPCARTGGVVVAPSQCGMLPVEYYQAEFDAINTAVSLGITVVEAAGNGSVNLDHSAFSGTLTRSSGAVIVGATQAGLMRRANFSNFGSRVQLNGWGNSVATLGVGRRPNSTLISVNGTDETQWYNTSFGGTSSATPLVTGAICNLTSWYLQTFSTNLTTAQVVALLRDTGTPQQDAPPSNIGVEPNLKSAIERPFGAKPAGLTITGATFTAWRPSTGIWSNRITSDLDGRFEQWGAQGDVPVPADYDGDGYIDLAVWRPSNGTWYIISSLNGSKTETVWGVSTDTPVPSDYDGDGRADLAYWRPSNGNWNIIKSSNGGTQVQQWGQPGDVPVPGRYDSDNKSDIAVWRPGALAYWFVLKSVDGTAIWPPPQWGRAGDKPVPADYGSDGRLDLAVWRPNEGTWHVVDSASGATRMEQWGAAGDIPVPGRYAGNDARADFVVFRPTEGKWYVKDSLTLATFPPTTWGAQGDVPIPRK